MTLVVSSKGETQKFSTIEQVIYWLRKKWPVADRKRDIAIDYADAAMNCLVTVGAARKAFLAAAKTAGFHPSEEIAGTNPGNLLVPFDCHPERTSRDGRTRKR
ncbi:DUF982 domain-containing protein [Pelagimonas sp. KU-00592-HH]|uniref:DUF982 domain-containing protein n=1 Tax=Pelagimonas sp. KU-00592-HH TaxID=3127651 RepID=UPI00333F75F1